MRIVDDLGLRIGIPTAAELLDGLPSRDIDVDVLRVESPHPSTWERLRRRGFVPKPEKISWLAETTTSDDEFLDRLMKKDRWNIRSARRAAVDAGLQFVVEDVVHAARLDEFIRIYLEQVGQMRFGHPYALAERDRILSVSGGYVAVWALAGTELVGGCLVHIGLAARFAKIRFVAVEEQYRRISLSRVIFLEAVRVSRDRGFSVASLGTEPNLYGHIAKAGLYSFKLRLGFTPKPSHFVGNAGSNMADRIIRLTALKDPSFILGYPPSPMEWEGGHAYFYTGATDLDLSPYRPGLMAGSSIVQLPQP